jgi:hypothetical protein
MNARLAEAMQRRQRAEALAGLRKLAARPAAAPLDTTPLDGPAQAEAGERCDVCGRGIPDEHRHLLDLEQRQIACSCDTCWSRESGEARYIPVGTRTVWLDEFQMPDDLWASFGIPIGLAFFMWSSVTNCVVALYPSPAGATESELHFSTWNELVALNPVLQDLTPDAEALIVNRMGATNAYAIAPIDRCYMLVGLVKANWQGISGGPAIGEAVERFFAELHDAAVPA